METKFKITGPGLYKRRDDSVANLVYYHGNSTWKDTYTNYLYYEDGYYGCERYESPNDIVAKVAEEGAEQAKPEPPGVHEMAKMFLFNPQPAIEYAPDRLGIAAQILAGFCADPKATNVDDHEVECAVKLADKLIARVKFTQP